MQTEVPFQDTSVADLSVRSNPVTSLPTALPLVNHPVLAKKKNQKYQCLFHYTSRTVIFQRASSFRRSKTITWTLLFIYLFKPSTQPANRRKTTRTKSREGFSKKLDDVLHDIIVLKRAVHNPDPKMTLLTDLNFLPRYQQR